MTLADQALAVVRPAFESSPGDAETRRVLAETYVARGEVRAATGDSADARQSWEHGLATVDSLARATRQTDLLALQATALLDLGRVSEARPVVRELIARGYREPRFVALAEAKRATAP